MCSSVFVSQTILVRVQTAVCHPVLVFFFLQKQTPKFIFYAAGVCVFQVLSDEVVGEPVHEEGLCRRYRHGEVHPQLVPGSSHQPPLCRRL